jgi:hypothetical protein
MKDAKATRSGKLNEDSIEQPAWAFERAASEFTEGAVRMEDAAAKVTDQAVGASFEMVQRTAKTAQHMLECGAKLTGQMTERSVDQFGRGFGFSGEGAQKVAQTSSHNIEALVRSGMVFSEVTRGLFEEWADIARARMDRGFDRISRVWLCRTPQDFAALQSEVLRDNMETLLGYAWKAGEHSARLAEKAEQRFGSGDEVTTSRQDALGGQIQMAQGRPAHRASRAKSAHKRSALVGKATSRTAQGRPTHRVARAKSATTARRRRRSR